ncbi:hypothetical protein BGZ94_003431 [Podila epigama]|nr:hypothetical protein BGZ94_003431 [Podila epigama]
MSSQTQAHQAQPQQQTPPPAVAEAETRTETVTVQASSTEPQAKQLEAEPVQQEPTTAILSVLPPTTTAAKPSRLSAAFKKISNGCGLCIHPFRNSGPSDYRALVHTPTDEEPETGLDAHSTAPELKTHDKDVNIASSSVATADHTNDDHRLRQSETKVESSSTSYDVHDSYEVHVQVQQQQQQEQEQKPQRQPEHFVSTLVEEITVDDDNVETGTEQVIQIKATPDVQEAEAPSKGDNNKTQDKEDESTTKDPVSIANLVPTAPVTATNTTTTPENTLPAVSPASTRATGAFAKFTKRSNSSSVVSASGATTTTTTTTTPGTATASSSPLLERLGRFAKIIKPSETSSSVQSKVVESLAVSEAAASPATTEVTPPSQPAVIDNVDNTVQEQPKEPTVVSLVSVKVKDSSTTVTDAADDEKKRIEEVEEKVAAWTAASPQPEPQQQQTFVYSNNRRESLTLLENTTSTSPLEKSQPVAIPSPLTIPVGQQQQAQAQLIHPWTNSPTTLHHNDASSSSNPSLSRVGRSSTLDSTVEGASESGSLDSGSHKEVSVNKVTKQRRKSVLKKLGKIINTMNTNTKRRSTDSKDRMSRQGSMNLESPIEVEENFVGQK